MSSAPRRHPITIALLVSAAGTACSGRAASPSGLGDSGSTTGDTETSSIGTADAESSSGSNGTTADVEGIGTDSTGAVSTTSSTADLVTSTSTDGEPTWGDADTQDSRGTESTSGNVSTGSTSTGNESGSDMNETTGTATWSPEATTSTSTTYATTDSSGSTSTEESSGETGGMSCMSDIFVDQSNLVSDGNLTVAEYQTPAQTFHVSQPGILQGFELALLRCTLLDDQLASFSLFGASPTPLATVALLGLDVPHPGWCGIVPDPLELGQVSGAFVDFSPYCINLEPDVEYRLELALIGDGVCGDDGYCEETGSYCMSDSDCANDYRIGVGPDEYINGTALVGSNPLEQWDLSFKVLLSIE
jgi:hypothetical protein